MNQRKGFSQKKTTHDMGILYATFSAYDNLVRNQVFSIYLQQFHCSNILAPVTLGLNDTKTRLRWPSSRLACKGRLLTILIKDLGHVPQTKDLQRPSR